MTASVQYLEAAKIEEVAAELRNKGYEVTLQPQGADEGFDLIATKGNKKLAVEVKVSSQLRNSAEAIKNLREHALEHGYDEFRLVVVNPPHDIPIKIERLNQELCQYLTKSFPNEIDEIAPVTNINSVSDIDVESIEITVDGIRISGNGVIEVELGIPIPGDAPTWEEYRRQRWTVNLPFSFDIKMGQDLHISEVYKLEIDKSSL